MDEWLYERPIIGVDLGGTKVCAGRVEAGRVAEEASALIDSRASEQDVLALVEASLARVFTEDVAGIGVGVPSVVDVERGTVFDVQNIPSWKEVPLGEILARRFGRPVDVNNDANCFAAGERHFGKGRAWRDFAGVTLGTGVGTGLIIDGRLYNGSNCGAGEFGMVPYRDSVLEHYAGGLYFERRHGLKGEEAQARAERGDPAAVRMFAEYGGHVGDALMIIMLAVDPRAIILGGSVTKAFALFEEPMRRRLEAFPYRRSVERIVIEVSNEPRIAILGAAALFLDAGPRGL